MNAIKLLKQQHREVRKLFKEADATTAPQRLKAIVGQIADQLALHCTIEEKLFYPGAMVEKTEDLLREAVEEHLGVKRILADLLAAEPSDPQYRAKLAVVKEEVSHHVEEEEEGLFPRVEKALDGAKLSELGAQMEQLANETAASGPPRQNIPKETSAPAPLSPPAKERKPAGRRAQPELRD